MKHYRMKRSVVRLSSVLAFGALIGDGCNSEQTTAEFRGRLVEQVSQLLSDETGARMEFNADELDALRSTGADILGDAEVLVMAPEPLAGRWLQIDGRTDWFRTEADGSFRIPDLGSEPAKTSAHIFREVLDDVPEASISLASLTLKTDGMPTAMIRILLPLPDDMNVASNSPGQLGLTTSSLAERADPTDGCEAHCAAGDPKVVSKAPGCCLDYDGPQGDGVGRDTRQEAVCMRPTTGLKDVLARKAQCELCGAKVRKNFKQSTCYNWTRSDHDSACRNESAYCGLEPLRELGIDYGFDKDEFELGVGSIDQLKKCRTVSKCYERYLSLLEKCRTTRPNCYHNHKYRNCQNLDMTAFSVSPTSATVAPGGKVTFRIRNNTVANRTIFDYFDSPNAGEVTGARSVGSQPTDLKVGAMRVVDHYSDALMKHFEEVEVTYVAPKKTPSKSRDEKLCGDKPGTRYFLVAPGMGPGLSAKETSARLSQGKQVKIVISDVGATHAGLARSSLSSEDDSPHAASCSACSLLDAADLQAVTGLDFSNGTADPSLPSSPATGCSYDAKADIPCYEACCFDEEDTVCHATAGIHLAVMPSGLFTPEAAKRSRPPDLPAIDVPGLGDEAFYFNHFGLVGPPTRVDMWAFEGGVAVNCFYTGFFNKSTDTVVLECAELTRMVFSRTAE